MKVYAESIGFEKKIDMRMKMRQFSNSAMLASGWYSAVLEYKIEEGDIILIDFNPDSDGGLHLIMVGMTTTEDLAKSTY